MEPKIIDFYNEFPYGVNVIENMNKELEEIQKENDILKKKIQKYETPQIIYKNNIEFNEIKENAFLDLKKKLYLGIQYNMGMIENTDSIFKQSITELLLCLTKGKFLDWVEFYSDKIVDCLNEKILTENGFFEYLYEQSYVDERFLADYFYKSISHQICNKKNGILNQLCIINCEKCNILKNQFKNNQCKDCLNKNISNKNYGGTIYIEGLGKIKVPVRNTKEEVINIISICGINTAKEIFEIN